MINNLKKVKFLISKGQTKSLIILAFLLSIGMILEIFCLAILIPTISFVLDPNYINELEVVKSYLLSIGIIERNSIVFVVLATTVILYIVKTVFLVGLTHKHNFFLSNISADLSNRLFSKYLHQPYAYHLETNSSDLLKNLQIDITHVNGFLNTLLSIVIEGGLLISVIATLIYVEPIGAIFVGLFLFFTGIIFYQLLKNKLSIWGVKKNNLEGQLSKNIMEGLTGIKDFKIMRKEEWVENIFSKNNFLKAKVVSNHLTVTSLPRYFLELISIIGLTVFIMLMLIQNKQSELIITTLTVFVAAIFRMIPSINKIMTSFQFFKYYEASLDLIYKQFKTLMDKPCYEEAGMNKIYFKKELKIDNLYFRYSPNKKEVIKNLSIKILKGQIIGFVGESGSGKSSLIDLIIGLHKPTSGTIKVDGMDINENLYGWQRIIGYVSQNIFLTDDSILNNIALGIDPDKIDLKAIDKAIKSSNLEKVIKNLPDGLNTRVGERGVQFSGGQVQRIAIARAIYHDPKILVFDEATASLDSKTEKGVMESIYSLGGEKTILIIAHKRDILRGCDRIIEIK
ncbi:MAG: hypothetical protein CMC91_03700 [Flavobacteriaceae bacterium]|nr:hypothetical protein [Flavobacteriaceae bacterium]|tara:strand:- start:37162 stop:38865 length:1704 start_codon:yes stop_codon:yes gene_type:complete